MAIKVPIRTVYDNANNAIGLSEMQAGEAVGYAHGGTGLISLGTSGQVLQVNEAGDGYEFGNKTSVNLNPYLQVANANISFVTKSTAVTTNNALINLINDRMQVANVELLVSTSIDNVIAAAPGTLDTLNELAAAIGDDANFITTINTDLGTKASNTYVNQTFETKAVALNANNAQNNLINDRLQVANAAATYVTKSTAVTSNNNLLSLINDRIQVANVASAIRPAVSTVTSNTSVDTTDHNNAIIINSADTVVISIAASAGLTVGDTFKFYPIGTGDLRIDLDGADTFLGTSLSSTQISVYQNTEVSVLQDSQLQDRSNRDLVTTGLYTKVELLYVGSGNFVLTK